MEIKLQKGDVVKLKSGSPKMTIDAVWDSSTTIVACKCKWFVMDYHGLWTFQEGIFDQECLTMVDDSPPSE